MKKMKKKNVGIIGFGNIGGKLAKKILFEKPYCDEYHLVFVADTKCVYSLTKKDLGNQKISIEKKCPIDEIFQMIKKIILSCETGLDLVFLAIPTMDDGEIARRYILKIIETFHIPVVTCEKGSFGNFSFELYPHLDYIGFSATAGGGTQILSALSQRMSPNVREIHLVINGSLNFIFDGCGSDKPRPAGQVIEEAKALGYAEPGSDDYFEIIQGEAEGDIPKKVATVVNMCFGLPASKFIRAREIKINPLERGDLRRLLREARNRRYIVSFYRNDEKCEPDDIIGGFVHQFDSWQIIAGFQKLDSNSLFSDFMPRGVGNAFLTLEGHQGADGNYTLYGPGAGPGPTTAAMLRDAEKLLRKKLCKPKFVDKLNANI